MARTVGDVLNDARACTSSETALGMLEDALAKAEPYELQSIASAAAEMATVPDPALAAILDRILARVLDEHEHHGVFEVATLRATRLGDAAGAHAALEACATRMADPDFEPRGFQWVQLANAFAKRGDPTGVERMLTLGRDRALADPDRDDLVDIASAWATQLEREVGIALLREAEVATVPPSPWSLANAWHALELPAEANRVLDGALAKAQVVSEALHVLSAARSHGDDEHVRAAFSRGETLATEVADWLSLGEAAFDSELGVDAIRRTLERAESLEPDERAIDRIAAGYRVWLLDPAAAARFGERDVLPDERHERVRQLGEPASASALFDWLRERATPEMLEQIAGADGFSYAKHLAALQAIVLRGRLPRVLGWEPHEALALTRWSDGVNVDHLQRAFACVILCIAEPEELATNGPIVLESCLALGAEPTALAAQLFAWCCEIADATVLPVATLLVVLAAPELEPPAIRLVEVDAAALADHVFTSMRAELWRTLIAERLVPLRTTSPAIDHVLAQLLPD